jgi:hypothetical protein
MTRRRVPETVVVDVTQITHGTSPIFKSGPPRGKLLICRGDFDKWAGPPLRSGEAFAQMIGRV